MPSYYSKVTLPPRSTNSTQQDRIAKVVNRMKEQEEKFMDADSVQTFEELKENLDKLVLPEGVSMKTDDE